MVFVDPGDPARLTEALRARFLHRYGMPAVAVARAPGRVNLIGEHTDYNGGVCLPVALPHAAYAAIAPRADDQVRIASGQDPNSWSGTLADLGPGGIAGWASYVAGVAWALGEQGLRISGLDVLVDSTVPLGAGLSSSAALECSVAVALAHVLGGVDDRALISACIRTETEVAGAPTGGMDQTVSMLAERGSALLIDFGEDSTRLVPLSFDSARLALLVTDTRVTHALVDGGYAARRRDCETAAAALGLASLRHASLEDVDGIPSVRIRRRARHVVTELARVRAVVAAIEGGDWARVGVVFDDSHASMRDDFEISCPELDLAVTSARGAGALGARMTGGGFGGSSVALVPAELIDQVAAKIDAAFVGAGLRAPQHLRAEPAGAADLR